MLSRSLCDCHPYRGSDFDERSKAMHGTTIVTCNPARKLIVANIDHMQSFLQIKGANAITD